jgi:integrase
MPSSSISSTWKFVLKKLKIEYRKPYMMQHSFISMNLEAGVNPVIIGKLCGTSVKMIEKHYSSSTYNIILPDLS